MTFLNEGAKYAAPLDIVEHQLTKIWEAVLEIQPIGLRDNFFDDLGGHSLLAVRLFRQIEKSFGKQLTLATLFEAPTIEQLASVLRNSGRSTPWSSLVAIQTSGSKPPFFGIHGGGGGVFFYYDLARHLGSEQPVYGLQAQGLDEKQVPHSRVEDMAAHYIKEIRLLQPVGPYFLGGYSLGGKVAFEMAQQLHAQGEKVGMLALFDTVAPGYLKPLQLHHRAFWYLVNYYGLELKEKWVYLHQKVKQMQHLPRQFYSSHRQPWSKDDHNPPLPAAHLQADRDYLAQVYPGRAILFRASDQPVDWLEWRSAGPHLGWGRLVAGGLEIHEVPGHHLNMFNEPFVRVLAEKLRDCLEAAQADN